MYLIPDEYSADETALYVLARREQFSHEVTCFILDCLVLNDRGHRADHVLDVVRTTIRYSETHPHSIDSYTRHGLILAALAHDIGCWVDRKEHHAIAYAWILNTPLLEDVPFQVREVAASAALRHRASYKGNDSNHLDLLVAAADRGTIDYGIYVKRCYLFRYEKYRDGHYTKASLLQEIYSHLQEKFGPDGYAWKSMPQIVLREQQDAREQLMERVHDFDLLCSLVDRLGPKWVADYSEVRDVSDERKQTLTASITYALQPDLRSASA